MIVIIATDFTQIVSFIKMTFLSAFIFMTPSFLISGNCSVMLIFDVLLSHQDETKLTVQRNPKKLLICMIRSFSYVENITFDFFKSLKTLFTFIYLQRR